MSECVFCLIVAGELPSTKVYETDEVLAIRDINPAAPVHVIVFPKQHYTDIVELGESDPNLGGAMVEAVAAVARIEGVEAGFRTSFNTGKGGGQTVFHVHAHVMGGRQLSLSLG
ncbi:MAG: hypothetical protein RL745_1049 [Actinomycetota bacterium]